MPSQPAPCPVCGGPMHPQAKRCQDCHLAYARATLPRCCDCGATMKPGRERCQKCWRAKLRAEGTIGLGSAGKNRVDTCACGREKLARSSCCAECVKATRAAHLARVRKQRVAATRLVSTPAPAPEPKPKPTPAPKPLLVERLALRLQRDPRPDDEKLYDRLELLKAIERRVIARRRRERRSA